MSKLSFSIIITLGIIMSTYTHAVLALAKDEKNMFESFAENTCHNIYTPVCGQPLPADCPEGVECIQVMPPRVTYKNICLMHESWATFVHSWACIDNTWSTHAHEQSLIDWAYSLGMTQYRTPALFRTSASLSRQEAAAFVARYITKRFWQTASPCTTPFRDLSDIDSTLLESVYSVCGRGLMLGNNGYFHPRLALSEAEALALLMRAIDGKQDESWNPWYHVYIAKAQEKNMNISISEWHLPITRIRFVQWIFALDTYLEKHGNTLPKNDITPNRLLGEWRLESFNALDSQKLRDAGVSDILFLVDSSELSARFCNMITWTYTLQNNTIYTQNLSGTHMTCDNTLLMSIESAFLSLNNSSIYAPPASSGAQSTKMTVITPGEHVFIFERRKP